jgi:predicted O-linked N-acetylglucosamine transferase (SPINDLY family)
MQQYIFSISSDEILAETLGFARMFEAPLRGERKFNSQFPQPAGVLKVGLVSADFRNHPVGIFLEGVLGKLDRDSLKLYAYANQTYDDSLSERIKPLFEKWNSVSQLSDDQLADQIRSDEIDLLIDLSGHTADNRLLTFARRPDPVQATWLGYANTTGLESMDYILADHISLPKNEEQFYTEKVWRLPETYVCFTPPDFAVLFNNLPAQDTGYITFGCFNKPTKINDAVISCWAEILRATPKSVLLLKYRDFDHETERDIFRKRFSDYGIDSARVSFVGASPRGEHLLAYQKVDFCLDPFPFPGLTTTCEALWMGVPTLTLRMARGMYGHNGELVMKSVGLNEWVVDSIDEYRERAKMFAENIEWLATLRSSLRQALLSSPLCAAERFARNLEDAFRGMVLASTPLEPSNLSEGQLNNGKYYLNEQHIIQ